MSHFRYQTRTLVEDRSFREKVVDLAVRDRIPMAKWNSDKKLQVSIYYTFAANIVLRDMEEKGMFLNDLDADRFITDANDYTRSLSK